MEKIAGKKSPMSYQVGCQVGRPGGHQVGSQVGSQAELGRFPSGDLDTAVLAFLQEVPDPFP